VTVLLDSGVLVGARWAKDDLHAPARRALDQALRGRWGRPFVTDFVVDEAVILARVRSRSHALADDLAAFLLGEAPYPATLGLLRVDEAAFTEARDLFRRHQDRFLSFTDCTTLALAAQHRVDAVLSFDKGFDGLAERIDPSSLGS
jgi:uncharacterized protein